MIDKLCVSDSPYAKEWTKKVSPIRKKHSIDVSMNTNCIRMQFASLNKMYQWIHLYQCNINLKSVLIVIICINTIVSMMYQV